MGWKWRIPGWNEGRAELVYVVGAVVCQMDKQVVDHMHATMQSARRLADRANYPPYGREKEMRKTQGNTEEMVSEKDEGPHEGCSHREN